LSNGGGATATLLLGRPDADGGGEFQVLLDGRKVAAVASGDRVEMEVPPGHHQLQFRFFYISSAPIQVDLAGGQTQRFVAERAFGFGPFDIRYFTKRHSAIRVRNLDEPGDG
jgi:hypothetical protein